eukprot:65872-Lingulodinium_polyedra.AAC.1
MGPRATRIRTADKKCAVRAPGCEAAKVRRSPRRLNRWVSALPSSAAVTLRSRPCGRHLT